MEKKICSKCKIEKDVSEFGILKKTKDGVRSVCKLCVNKTNSIYSKTNREKRNEIQRLWRQKNKEKVQNYQTKFSTNNKEKISEYTKKYRKKYPEKIKQHNKNYYHNNLQASKDRVKKWIQENEEKRKNYLKKWKENNKNHIKQYKKNKYHNDVLHKLGYNCRNRINGFLKTKNMKKSNKTFGIVGCSPAFLKEHLEKQFVSGMTWDNRNEWHIDHIIPLYDAKTEEELYKLCHYSNLQPLWGKDNMKKSNKLNKTQ